MRKKNKKLKTADITDYYQHKTAARFLYEYADDTTLTKRYSAYKNAAAKCGDAIIN